MYLNRISEPVVEKSSQPEKSRNASYESSYDLELPDEDDHAVLTDFNEKCNLTKYSDGSFGCVLLVRQPFRNTSVLAKTAFQKITDVRTWTEFLVRFIDGKKLCFYSIHDLMSYATSLETTMDKVIEAMIIKVKDDGEARKVAPFHEIELKSSHKFTDLSLQQFDNYTKIHTFKIQELIFKETIQVRPDRIMAIPERFLKRFTKPKVTSLIDHTPIPLEIVKFAHLNYQYLKSFLLLIQDSQWYLPTITRKLQREQQLQQLQQQPPSNPMSITSAAATLFSFAANKPIQTPTLSSVTANHAREEITVKVVDEYKCKLDQECRILEHKSRTRVYLITFLNSPEPVIDIGLNDCLRHGKEVVGRLKILHGLNSKAAKKFGKNKNTYLHFYPNLIIT